MKKENTKGIERIGVSIEKNLLSAFDKLAAEHGYQSRSEAFRDLIREKLSSKQLDNPKAKGIAALCLVFDHHSTKILQKLTELQHSNLLKIICSTHIHLNAHDCMEIIILKGQAGEINKIAERIISQKGVKLGRLNVAPTQIA